jgi:hypothetical protein
MVIYPARLFCIAKAYLALLKKADSSLTQKIHCGDGRYGTHLKKIGKKYGLFGVALMGCAQYNLDWPNGSGRRPLKC